MSGALGLTAHQSAMLTACSIPLVLFLDELIFLVAPFVVNYMQEQLARTLCQNTR